jgi:hypothetical protein
VEVTSKGSVLINGNIQNPSGDTHIKSTDGEIVQVNDGAVVSGENILLEAKKGIRGKADTGVSFELGATGTGSAAVVAGLDGAALLTNLSDAGGTLNAVTSEGNINIREVQGNLYIDNVTTGAGDVTLRGRESILARDGNDQGLGTLVKGGAIDLRAEGGSIGTASQTLTIDTGNTRRDGLSAVATGVINVTEAIGNLNLVRAHTNPASDVFITVALDLTDANTSTLRDTRTEEQLLKLYEDMRLTGRAADRGIIEGIDGYEGGKVSDYNDYWAIRFTQPHAPIEGLEDGGTCYVINVVGDTFQLAATAGGPALDLDNANASGKLHQLFSGDGNAGLFDPATAVNSTDNTITMAARLRGRRSSITA